MDLRVRGECLVMTASEDQSRALVRPAVGIEDKEESE